MLAAQSRHEGLLLHSEEGGEASELSQGAAATACCAAAHLLPAAIAWREPGRLERLALFSHDEGVCTVVSVAASATTHRMYLPLSVC